MPSGKGSASQKRCNRIDADNPVCRVQRDCWGLQDDVSKWSQQIRSLLLPWTATASVDSAEKPNTSLNPHECSRPTRSIMQIYDIPYGYPSIIQSTLLLWFVLDSESAFPLAIRKLLRRWRALSVAFDARRAGRRTSWPQRLGSSKRLSALSRTRALTQLWKRLTRLRKVLGSGSSIYLRSAL